MMPSCSSTASGMGDSDKPRDCPYSTTGRTDLIEAL